MDRAELRFRILFEYYQELHSDDFEKYNARTKIKEITAPDHEKRAAQIWLIDEGHVQGLNNSYGGSAPLPSISRINSNGINYVEYVMDIAFTKIADDASDIKKLSNKERIEKFAKECLKSKTTEQICKATFDAITTYMTSSGPN